MEDNIEAQGPFWQDAIRRLRQSKHDLSERRINTLALLWLSFRHGHAKEIAELPLFIKPQIAEASESDLFKQLEKDINHTSGTSWLLEGDAGMGKTTFCYYLCNKYWESFLDGECERIPIFIFLVYFQSDFNLKRIISCLSENIVQSRLPTNVSSSDMDLDWLIQEPLLLILDGFDELKTKINYYTTYDWGSIVNHYHIKVVYACRPEALQNKNRRELFGAPDVNGKGHRFQSYYLDNINSMQINTFIDVYSNPAHKLTILPASWYKEWLKKLPGLEQVIEVPQLLRIVLDILPNIVKSKQEEKINAVQQHFTRWKIYEEFVWQRIEQQAARIRRDGHRNPGGLLHRLKGSLEEYLFSYISNLATTRWYKNSGNINNESLSSKETLKPEFMEPRIRKMHHDGLKSKEVADNEYLELLDNYNNHDKDTVFSNIEAIKIVRSGSLLRIDNKSYRFIHKTIIEYLTIGAMAYTLRNQFSQFLQNIDSIQNEHNEKFDINSHPLRSEPNMIAGFVEQFGSNIYFKKLLYKIVKKSKTIPGLAIAASNAITLLNLMGENFSGKDFSDVQIPYADLRGGVFDNTNFCGANLEFVWFHKAWLREANFSGANLKNVELGTDTNFKLDSPLTEIVCYEPKPLNSYDNQHWLVGCEDGYIYQWSTKAQSITRKYDIGHGMLSSDAVSYVAVHNDSGILLAKCNKKDITVWSLGSGNKLHTIKGTKAATKVKLSPNGKMIALIVERKLTLWSLESGECLQSLWGPAKSYDLMQIFSFGGKGDILAVVNFDTTVDFWSINTGVCIRTLAHDKEISHMCFSPDGDLYATAYIDGSVNLRLTNADEVIYTVQTNLENQINDIFFSQDSNLLYIVYDLENEAYHHKSLMIWDRSTKNIKLNENFFNTVGFVENSLGVTIVEYNNYKFVTLYNLEDRILKQRPHASLKKLSRNNDNVGAFAFHPTYLYFASWDQKNNIKLFATRSGECVHTFRNHEDSIRGLVFSPDGEWLASWSNDGVVILSSMKSSDTAITFNAHHDCVLSLEFSENSQLFCTSGADNVAKIWSVKDGKCFMLIPDMDVCRFHQGDSIIALFTHGETTHRKLKFWEVENNNFIDNYCCEESYLSSMRNHQPASKNELDFVLRLRNFSEQTRSRINAFWRPCNFNYSDDDKTLSFINYGPDPKDRPKLTFLNIDTNAVVNMKLSQYSVSYLNPDDNDLFVCYFDDKERTKSDIWSIKKRVCIKSFTINHMTKRFKLLYGNSMLLAFGPDSFSLFEFDTARYVLGFDFSIISRMNAAMPICEILWMEAQSDVIIIFGNKENTAPSVNLILRYNFNSLDDVKWTLMWSHGGLPENFNDINVRQSIDVSSSNLFFFKKFNVRGKPAIPEVKYSPLNSIIVPLSNTARVGLRPSLIQVEGLQLTLSPEIWVVNIAQKKEESHHVFLTLEGIMNFRRFIIKADLTTSGNIVVINITPVDGQHYTLERFIESTKNYNAQQWQITSEFGKKLIDNIRADQCATITYKILGDQGGKRDDLENELHNCVSWCRKQLRLIGIDLPDKWYNFLVTLPEDVISPPVAKPLPASDTTTSFGSNNNFFQTETLDQNKESFDEVILEEDNLANNNNPH